MEILKRSTYSLKKASWHRRKNQNTIKYENLLLECSDRIFRVKTWSRVVLSDGAYAEVDCESCLRHLPLHLFLVWTLISIPIRKDSNSCHISGVVMKLTGHSASVIGMSRPGAKLIDIIQPTAVLNADRRQK
ncbi:hypothetical protein J6590_098852 [Homalodisca vitripennis]|nr:hypothetical protein J6590_098852 [Homalodisca vitripennis]